MKSDRAVAVWLLLLTYGLQPLDVRSVAVALGVSPKNLYKYDFNREINAADQRQRENGFISAAAIEQDYF